MQRHLYFSQLKVGMEEIFRTARLKPDMAASYIYYHDQMQEERPESFNKTIRKKRGVEPRFFICREARMKSLSAYSDIATV